MVTSLLAALLLSAPSKVAVTESEGKWALEVDGKPFVVQGGGGDASKDELKRIGGNSFRTWGADDLDKKLGEAQKLGLKVTVGIWLGHLEHGFKYDDPVMVKKQLDDAKAVFNKYKDHPALLMWGIGNEMEGFGEGNDPKIWQAVEDMAHAAHTIDPNHPTMTVIAEIGGKKVPSIQKYCPSIDIVGINSYGGAASIYDRYTKQGGKKPYIVTEFGPPGAWETAATAWKRPIEKSSTAKEESYRAAYESNVVKHPELCLGAYAFAWGNKVEATATWFGMFLADGSRTGAVDVMEQFWTGKKPKHPSPRIASFQIEGEDEFEPGSNVAFALKVSDPSGEPVKVSYSLTTDGGTVGTNGDREDMPNTIRGAVTRSALTGAIVHMPTEPGPYRLYVVARNKYHGSAVANIPILVRGSSAPAMGSKVQLPFSLYSNSGEPMPYALSGWMGSTKTMKVDTSWTDKPHSGPTCIRWDYTANEQWGAVAWQSPDNDWGDKPGGYDWSGASKLTLWARGKDGGEEISFGIGTIKADKPYYDTAIIDGGKHVMGSGWQRIVIPLGDKDLRRIKTGLVMTMAGQGLPVTVFIDDVTVE